MADRQPSRLGLRQHLRRFERYFRDWVQEYFEEFWHDPDPVVRMLHFPPWNLSQRPWMPRVHTPQDWRVFEMNAVGTVHNYVAEQGWDAYLPRTREFMDQARAVARRRMEALRRLNRHLDP